MEPLLLLVSTVLLAGVWSTRLNSRLGLPVLVGFLAIGTLLGPGGLAAAPHISPLLIQYLGYVALILILFEGGLHTSVGRIRSAWVPSLSLATVGVVVSATVLAASSHALLHNAWVSDAMVGVAVSSTDAAAVFTTLGGQPLRKRLVDVLEVESGANDPMAFFLMKACLEWAKRGGGTTGGELWHLLASFLLEMSVGLAIGVCVGWLASFVNQRIRLDAGGLYPTLSLAFALLSFALAGLFHGSGFLAVYVSAVVMAHHRIEHRYSVMRFHEGVAWTMQILMFVLLGMLLIPGHLGPVALPGLLLAVAALLVGRPLAVWLSTLFMGFDWRERLFLSWAGLRGAVPIVLILSAVVANLPQSDVLLDAVFFVVIISTMVQGPTVAPLAHQLQLVEAMPSESVWELVSIARENAIVLPIEIRDQSKFIQRRMVDIPFPPNTLCYAVIRGDRVLVPRGATRLHAGDYLLVLSDRSHIGDLQQRFHTEIVGAPAVLR